MRPKVIALFSLFFLMTLSMYGQTRAEIDQLIEAKSYDPVKELLENGLKNQPSASEKPYYLSKLGDIYYYNGDLIGSLKYYLSALEEPGMQHASNLTLRYETISYVGFVYRELGLDLKAKEYFERSLQLSIDRKDSVEMAISYYNISTIFLSQGLLDKSMSMLKKAYEIDLIRKDTVAIGFDLKAMGNSMLKTKNYEKAIQYYRQSIELLNVSSAHYNSLGMRYGLLAKAFMYKQAWDSAQFYTQQSILIHEKGSDSLHIGDQWVQLAHIDNSKSQFKDAEKWGLMAKNLFTKYPVSRKNIEVNNSLIITYMGLGQYNKALVLLRNNEQMSVDLELPVELRNTYQQMSQLYEKTGSYRLAIQVDQQADVLSDSINRMESQRMTEALTVRYDVDKIEGENALLKLENEVASATLLQREADLKVIVLVGIMLLVVAIAVVIIVLLRSRLKTQLLQAEVNELRTRIKGVLEFKPEEFGIVKEQINKALQDSLTDREFEILNLALSDKNNGQIAEEVFLSVNTVKYHLKNIYSKLGVSNRKEALKFAVQVVSN